MKSPNFTWFVSLRVERISALLDGCGGKTVVGDASQIDAAARYVPPMLISRPDHASELLKQEIFGPILPVVRYSAEQTCVDFINKGEKPLAMYVFTTRSEVQKLFVVRSFLWCSPSYANMRACC